MTAVHDLYTERGAALWTSLCFTRRMKPTVLKLLDVDGHRLLFRHSFNRGAMEVQREQLVKIIDENDTMFAFRGAVQITRKDGTPRDEEALDAAGFLFCGSTTIDAVNQSQSPAVSACLGAGSFCNGIE